MDEPANIIIRIIMLKERRGESLTEEERLLLDEWAKYMRQNESQVEQLIRIHLELNDRGKSTLTESKREDQEDVALFPFLRARLPKKRRVASPGALLAIAAALLCVVVGVYLVGVRARDIPSVKSTLPVVGTISPTRPSGREVILIRSGGSAIDLDTAAIGSVVAVEGDYVARKADESSLVYTKVRDNASDTVAIWHSLAIGRGRTEPWRVFLPDGSFVCVSAASLFSFYLQRRRPAGEAMLEGTAFFDIAHDRNSGYSIRTPEGGRISVLGTRFLVETDSTKASVRVVLYTGKIKVTFHTSSAILRPAHEALMEGKRIRVFRTTDSAGTLYYDAQGSRSFKFRNTPMRDAIKKVAAWYGYRLNFVDAVKGIPISDSLMITGDVESVLEDLEAIEKGYVYFRRKGDVISVASKPFK